MWEKPGSTRSFNKIVRHHALPTCHAETLIDDPDRIDAPPAHHTIALPVLSRSGPVSTIRARSRICRLFNRQGRPAPSRLVNPSGSSSLNRCTRSLNASPSMPVPQCQSLNASSSMPVPQCQFLNVSPSMSGGPFRQSAPPPFASCHRRQQPMPEVVVSSGCLNIAAQGGASWRHQNHREGVQQQAWHISFAMVNHKINERGTPPEPELYQVGIMTNNW